MQDQTPVPQRPVAEKDARRHKSAADTSYLQRVGERVRALREQRGLTRKALSHASNVSERYLADLEAGTGNASIMVLRHIVLALETEMSSLLSEDPSPSNDMAALVGTLSQLSPSDLANARRLITRVLPLAPRRATHRIALIGLRGAGKTTVGRAVSQQLALPFVELDREIERAAGMELSEIFALQGKDAFRQHEIRCLEAVIDQHEKVVIATGGGLVTEAVTYELLLATCQVVWLKAAPESHMARVMAQGDLRPMSGRPQAMDDLRAIFANRQQLYARAHVTVETTDTTHEQAVRAVLQAVGIADQAAK
jgi:XRE family transcriptional regulator, aerobic/anaerobic benzoate catabolism transcriptional regulator